MVRTKAAMAKYMRSEKVLVVKAEALEGTVALAQPLQVSATHVASTDTNQPTDRKTRRAGRAAT